MRERVSSLGYRASGRRSRGEVRSGSVTLAGEGGQAEVGVGAVGQERWGRGPHPPWFIDRVTPLAASLTNSPPYLRSLFLSLIFLLLSPPLLPPFFPLFLSLAFSHPVSGNSINYLERNWVRISPRLLSIATRREKSLGENILNLEKWKRFRGYYVWRVTPCSRDGLIFLRFFKVPLLARRGIIFFPPSHGYFFTVSLPLFNDREKSV